MRWPEPEPWMTGAQERRFAVSVTLSVLGERVRRAEGRTRLGQWPQFVADIDDVKVHFLHIRSSHADARL